MALTDKLKAIGDAIRKKTGKTDLIPLSDMPNEILNISSGGDNYYDEFWNSYQNHGNRESYKNAFGNTYWNNDTFKPKYDLNIRSNSYNIFDDSQISGSLPEILKSLGIKMEITNISYQSGGFVNTQFTEVEYLFKNCAPTLSSVFGGSNKLHTLKIGTIVKSQQFNNTFGSLPALVNLTVEGEIGQNGFDVSKCPLLSKASIENVVNCLSDDTTDKTITFSKTSVNNAFGINIDDESTYTEEFTSLKNSKNNWTFSFV